MGETKTARIDIRVTESELNAIRKTAHSSEMSISEYLLYVAEKDRERREQEC